jgi:UDP-glucose 4-epimerase
MKVAVTGCTGFIGSHVAVRLAQAGHRVVATSRDPSKVVALGLVPGIETRRGDLSEPSTWAACLKGCDALVHVALGWGDEPIDMLHADTEASVRLFQAAVDTGVRTIVYTSSTAACGEMEALNTEERTPKPTDFYGATKAATEAYLRAFAHRKGVRAHVIRPGYIFGEAAVEGAHAQPDTRFRELVRAAANGDEIRLVKHDGTQFLHVQDIAEVYLRLLDHDESPTLHYALSREWTSWETIAGWAAEIAGRPLRLVLEDRGYGATPYVFDVSRIERDFGLSFPAADRLRAHLRWEFSRL